MKLYIATRHYGGGIAPVAVFRCNPSSRTLKRCLARDLAYTGGGVTWNIEARDISLWDWLRNQPGDEQ